MKNVKLKLICAVLIIIFALSMMPLYVSAADEAKGIILEKSNGDKIIYIKGEESKEFKYAFSDDDDTSNLGYMTSLEDGNGNYVGLLEQEKTYKYMFIKDGDKIELEELDSISEEEINELETLTKRINVNFEEKDTTVSNDNGTVVTKTTGKIVVTDSGNYQYELIEIVDKNNSVSELNETATELYSKINELNNENKIYDKLSNYITIRDDYKKLVNDANWEDAKNKEILEPENSQSDEKFIVLIQEIKDGKSVRDDIQIMTCKREDAKDVEYTEKQETKTIEKRTKLPVTGENLALYIILAVVIISIIVLFVKMKMAEKSGKHRK